MRERLLFLEATTTTSTSERATSRISTLLLFLSRSLPIPRTWRALCPARERRADGCFEADRSVEAGAGARKLQERREEEEEEEAAAAVDDTAVVGFNFVVRIVGLL